MAQLLKIQPNQPNLDVGVQRVPVNSWQIAGQGANQLGESLNRLEDAADKTDAIKIAADTKATWDAKLVELNDTIADPAEFRDQAMRSQQEIFDGQLDTARGQRSRGLAKDMLSNDAISHTGKINHVANLKTLDKTKGDYISAKEQLINSASRSTGENQAGVVRMYGDLLGSLVRDGVVKASEAPKEQAEFFAEMDKRRAGNLLETDPLLLKATINEKNFPYLTAAQRYTLGQHADEAIRERGQAQQQMEKVRLDGINKGILSATEAQGASLAVIRQKILERTDLPFETQKFWTDRLNHMIEQKNKPAKEAKEIDPFKTSDSATLAKATKGILSGDPEWTKDRVLDLMGNGLSVQHASQAVNMIDRVERQPSGQLTPLKMAQNTWNHLQSSSVMAFVPADERIKNVAEAAVKNSREAQKVWDEVVQREAKGQDPRVVLEELMQPYYDEKVKGWFEAGTISGMLALHPMSTGTTQPEIVKARQDLIRRGIPTTDENVNALIQRTREKTTLRAAGSQEDRIKQLQEELIKLKSKK